MISLLLPTRQRPQGLARLAESMWRTATCPSQVELVTWIDDDDFHSYEQIKPSLAWTRVYGPRVHEDGLVNLSAKWNACYEACHGDIVMHCGDDIVMHTEGWDDIVRDAFDATPDRILLAYGRDGIQDANDLATHGFVSREWIETVGYFLPALFSSDYNDCFLTDVAKLIDRHQKIPIYNEHLHHCVQKAPIDQNTQERLERHLRDRPDLLYDSPMVQAMIKEAADKLRGIINEAQYSDSHSGGT